MSRKPKKTGNLVALGSAAVVAVYGAGFMRTAAAAERFAEQSDERVLSPEDAAATGAEMKAGGKLPVANDSNTAVTTIGTVTTAMTTPTAPPASNAAERSPAPKKADATVATVDSNQLRGKPAASKRDLPVPVPPEVTTANATSTTTAVAAVPTNAKTVEEKATAPVATPYTVVAVTTPPAAVAPMPTVSPAAVPVAAPVVASPVAPVAATAPPATTDAPSASNAAPKLKDGEYTGYGTSRHGDIEVYLETTDGKITFVKISQCLTQYSCSWISDLPKQVLARQSARVDGVSGATQSANAFYYAVVQALAKAK